MEIHDTNYQNIVYNSTSLNIHAFHAVIINAYMKNLNNKDADRLRLVPYEFSIKVCGKRHPNL